MVDAHGRWDPMSVPEVIDTMRAVPARWWFTGGHALELHCGRAWREHDDIDVGICRVDAIRLRALLDEWEVFVAAGGELAPWHGEPLDRERNHNNLRVRRPGGPWRLDVVVGDGDDRRWVYRRDPTLTLPWHRAVRVTPGGVAYLAPELQLLFKSTDVRPKDQLDAEAVLPTLDDAALALLARHLPPDHPWQPG